jgi:hypothetical protein
VGDPAEAAGRVLKKPGHSRKRELQPRTAKKNLRRREFASLEKWQEL